MISSGRVQTQDLEQFRAWAKGFAEKLSGDEILLLSGEMGAGKTEFVKTVAAHHGIRDVASPTFALHHSMRAQGPAQTIDHLDLYRLESLDELETVGLWELLQSPSLVMIEWPERVPFEYWPKGRKIISIRIEKTGADQRAREISWASR